MWNDKQAEASGPMFNIQVTPPTPPPPATSSQVRGKGWGTARPQQGPLLVGPLQSLMREGRPSPWL